MEKSKSYTGQINHLQRMAEIYQQDSTIQCMTQGCQNIPIKICRQCNKDGRTPFLCSACAFIFESGTKPLPHDGHAGLDIVQLCLMYYDQWNQYFQTIKQVKDEVIAAFESLEQVQQVIERSIEARGIPCMMLLKRKTQLLALCEQEYAVTREQIIQLFDQYKVRQLMVKQQDLEQRKAHLASFDDLRKANREMQWSIYQDHIPYITANKIFSLKDGRELENILRLVFQSIQKRLNLITQIGSPQYNFIGSDAFNFVEATEALQARIDQAELEVMDVQAFSALHRLDKGLQKILYQKERMELLARIAVLEAVVKR